MTALTPMLHGFFLALGLVLPIGPQNMYVLQQGATQLSWRRTVPVVTAAACCDTAMIVCAVTGTSLLFLSAHWLQSFFCIVGVVFLLYSGWKQWNLRLGEVLPETATAAIQRIGTTLAVSILNPHAILDSVAVLGPSSLSYSGVQRWFFAVGCIVNSWIWFASLAFAGGRMRTHIISPRRQRLVGRIAAFLLWSSAIYLVVVLTG